MTNDQEEALGISDQVMVLNDEAIQQISQSQPLYERPIDLFCSETLENSDHHDIFCGRPTSQLEFVQRI